MFPHNICVLLNCSKWPFNLVSDFFSRRGKPGPLHHTTHTANNLVSEHIFSRFAILFYLFMIFLLTPVWCVFAGRL